MNLTKKETQYVYDTVFGFLNSINSIEDYIRLTKPLDLKKNVASSLFDHTDEFFSDWEMCPDDMKFEVINFDKNVDIYTTLLTLTSSHLNNDNPGRTLRLIVKETTTNKIVGFIRFGSPTINMKPRSDLMQGNTFTGDNLSLVDLNKHFINAFVIVPTQPFGYNYLGGKLLSLICTSHEVREMLNKKYDMELLCMETTSLYGSIKNVSQYDGLKPFIRYGGMTDSNFLLSFPDKLYKELKLFFKKKNENIPIVPPHASSNKLKTQTKIMSILKQNVKQHNIMEIKDFKDIIESKLSLTPKKRYYYSTFGYENIIPYILGDIDSYTESSINFNKHYLENIYSWWKKKATKRYDNLKKKKSLKKSIESWDRDQQNIKIIR